MQNNNFNNNFQNNGFYPNNFNNQQYAPVDAGEKDASTSMLLGIISLVLGPIFAIISLVFASKYKKVGNGQNAGKVKAGKICSWISIVGTLLSIIFLICSIFAIKSSIQIDVDPLDENSYYSENDFKYDTDAEYQIDNTILYSKDISENGEIVYNENGIEVILTEFEISHNKEFDTIDFDASYTIEMPDNYSLDFDGAYVNNEKTTPAANSSFPYKDKNYCGTSFASFTVNTLDDIDTVFCHYIIKDSKTGKKLFDFNIDLY